MSSKGRLKNLWSMLASEPEHGPDADIFDVVSQRYRTKEADLSPMGLEEVQVQPGLQYGVPVLPPGQSDALSKILNRVRMQVMAEDLAGSGAPDPMDARIDARLSERQQLKRMPVDPRVEQRLQERKRLRGR